MKLTSESDYKAKVLFLSFEKRCVIEDSSGVKLFQNEWLKTLKSWHSPYKALIDCSNLSLEPKTENLSKDFEKLKKFLERFFLRKAVAYGLNKSSQNLGFPFPVCETKEEALKALGVRDLLNRTFDKSNFRSLIAFDNHFKDETIELSFLSDIHLKDKKDLLTLKSKLMNNLMLWHSKWNLLIDCSKFKIDGPLFEEFSLLEKYFKGFFLKEIVGYSPCLPKENYPFPVYRSRHKAVLNFSEAGRGEGDIANCSSRK